MFFRLIYLLLGICFLPALLLGQDVENVNYYAKKYKGDNIVYSLRKIHVKIGYDKAGEPKIENTRTTRRVYLSDNAAQFSAGSVDYSEHYELIDIDVYALIPKGDKYKKEKVTEFATKTEFSAGIFHNGVESVNFHYPQLTKGAISVVTHTIKLKVPQLLSSFHIQMYYPTERLEIIVELAPGIEMKFSYQNADDPKYKPVITESKKGKVYTWTLTDIPAFDFEGDGPSLQFYTPHIIPRLASYQKNGKRVAVLTDLDDLYNWYYSLVAQTDKEPSDVVKAIVDSLVRGIEDEMEKISSIYYWVQDNIRYVAFEEGYQGFIPENAVNVCEKRYGDCKGLTSLMYTMMQYADIDAHFTWVGTRSRPYKYAEVPSPIVDNHMILSVQHDGQFYFVDATSNTSPIWEPTAFIQGKEVLVSIGEYDYKVIEVPVRPADYSTYEDSVYLSLGENGLLKGNGISNYSGYYNTSIRSILKRIPKDRLEEFMDDYLEKGSNKFNLDTFLLPNAENRDASLKIIYDFTLEDYARINKDEIYVNMSLLKIYIDGDLKKDRTIPFEVDYKSSGKQTTILEIPDGYHVSYLPESTEFKNEKFGFSYKVTQTGNNVIMEFEQYDNFLLLQKESFEDWNKMIRKLKQAYRESIILNKS